jgi:hypothetical protein
MPAAASRSSCSCSSASCNQVCAFSIRASRSDAVDTMRAAAWHSRASRRYSSALVRVTTVARWYATTPTRLARNPFHKEALGPGRPSRGLRSRSNSGGSRLAARGRVARTAASRRLVHAGRMTYDQVRMNQQRCD